MARPLRRFVAVALTLSVCFAGAALSGACSFEPSFDDGAFACSANGTCPDGFSCAADHRCYRGAGPSFDASPSGDADAFVPSGPQKVSFSTNGVDFGNVPCGATAPAEKSLTITNLGAIPLTWTASLSTTPDFSITSPTAGTIGPGGTATITLQAALVPALAGAGDTAQAVLTVTTNDPTHATTDFPVKRTSAGGTISVAPLTVDFGETPATIAADDIPIVLENVGNESISVGFGAISDPAFTLTCGGSPCPPSTAVAPGATFAGLVAHFTPPTAPQAYKATAAIQLTGATCGANPSTLAFAGTGVTGFASVQPGSLDFGLVHCGAQAAAKTFQIKNSGTAAFNWTASAPTHYVLSSTSGSVAAGASVTVTVTPNPIPASSAVTANLYGETVTITTDSPGDGGHTINLLETAQGAILGQSTNTIAFGSVRVAGAAATSTFTVSNTGNAAATVSYAVSNPAFALAPQNNTVTGGAGYTATASFTPTAAVDYSGTATMTVLGTDVLCAPLPPAIALSGRGAASASVSPTDVDFGLVDCGTTGSPKTVSFQNTGTQNFSWTASLAKGASSYFTLNDTGGQLPTGKSVTITITPKAIPKISATTPDLYGDTLTFTTNPPLESPYTAALHMTAQGVILTFNPATYDFGQVQHGTSRTRSFSVDNAGNAAAPVTLKLTGDNVFSLGATTGTANASASFNDSVTFAVPANGAGSSYNASVAVTTTAVTCANMPSAFTITGAGK